MEEEEGRRRQSARCCGGGAVGGGVGHLLAACPALAAARQKFLQKPQAADQREGKEPGLWLNTVFTHPADVAVLAETMSFVGAIGQMVRAARKTGRPET